MKKFVPLIFAISFIAMFFVSNLIFNYDSGSRMGVKAPVQGREDNPYAASEFRYKMLAGGNENIDLPEVRRSAIDYTEKNLKPKNLNKTNNISGWTALGPGNIGGRIRSIIINPTAASTILIGSVAGGVWKSTNGGSSWFPKLDSGDYISIGTMVMDPTNSNTVYAGSGEGWGNVDAVYGGGVYKSTDFGDTWILLSSTSGSNAANFRNVLKLASDPNGNIYSVTKSYNSKGGVGGYYTNGGLYKTSDGGTNWTKISSTTYSTNYFNGCDVVPISSSNIIFATNANGATLGGIYLTTTGGTNWNKITSGLPSANYGRIALTQDPNLVNTVYAVFESKDISTSGDGGLKGIYKTTDGGSNWTALSNPPKISSTGSRSYLSAQGWYDNIIAVDPHNSSNIYVGGVDMMKSTNGGSSWSQLTYWHSYYGSPVVHADHHAIVFDPNTSGVVYGGNDGGLYKTINGGTTWNDLNNGLEVTQFYGGAVFPTGSNYYGGTQDNGHLKYNGSSTNWTMVYGGDGGYAAIDQSNSAVGYEEYVYLEMSKTTNSGSTWDPSYSGLSDATSSSACLFIAPFSMNPETTSMLIAGSNKVWITPNSASSWTQSSNILSSGAKVSAVTVVNSGSTYLGFAGTTDGKIFICTNLNPASGIDTWTEITPVGNNGAWVRRITVDLNNKSQVYACYSGYNTSSPLNSKHVWSSGNQGSSWTDISTTLPNVPVHSLVVDKDVSSKLYIGTETGVYQTTDSGTSWVLKTGGMPSYVPVDELVRQTGTNKLFAFTHGRGAWVTDTPLPVELVSFTADVQDDGVKLNWKTATETNNFGFEIQRSNEKREFTSIDFIRGKGTVNIPTEYEYIDKDLTGGKSFSYRLKQIDIDGSFEFSNEVEIELEISSYKLFQNYPNPFNPSTVIAFNIPIESEVVITIMNVLGQELETIYNKINNPGTYKTRWNADNFSSGVYFYTLTVNPIDGSNGFSSTKKMLYVR